MRKIVTGMAVLVVGACLVVPGAAAASPGDRPDRTEVHQSVRGTGGAVSRLPNEYNGDYLKFAFDARLDVVLGAAPEYGGTFHVWHYRKDGTVGAEFAGEVTCLLASADQATLTGTITDTVVGDSRDGMQADFSVVGNGRRPRVGFGGEAWGDEKGNPCYAPAPYFAVEDGGYRVRADGL